MNAIKLLLSLFLCSGSLLVTSQIKIISDAHIYKDNIGNSWSSNPELVYANTLWGETFYNAGWQDIRISAPIKSESVIKTINFSPEGKRDWTLTIPIQNLNAEIDHEYSSTHDQAKTQNAENIYWGLKINFKRNKEDQSLTIWLKRADTQYKKEFISYSVDGDGWKEDAIYPSCDKENNTDLKIETHKNNYTYISWGINNLTHFSSYIDEISSIEIIVGTQAKIQVGKVRLNVEAFTLLESLESQMSEGKFNEAKSSLLKEVAEYGSFELLYFPLALCYLNLEEFNECIDASTALIKFQGKRLYDSYGLRGLAKESIYDYQGALADYKSAGSIGKEYYERLSQIMFKSKSVSRTNGNHIKYKHRIKRGYTQVQPTLTDSVK